MDFLEKKHSNNSSSKKRSSSKRRSSSKKRSSSKIIIEKPKMNELDKKIILSMLERGLRQVGHKKTILQNHSNIFYILIKQAFRSNTFEKSFEYIFSAIVTYIQIIKIYNTRKESSKKNKGKTLKWNVKEIQRKRKERAAKRGEKTPEDIIEIPKGRNVEIIGGKRNITRKMIRSGGGKGWWEKMTDSLEGSESGMISPFAFFTKTLIESRNMKLKDYPKQLNKEKIQEIEEAWEKGKKWDDKVNHFFTEVGKREILKDFNERVFKDDEFNSEIDGIFKLEDFSGLHITLLTEQEKIIFEYLIYLAYIKAYRPSDAENMNKVKTLASLSITTALTENLARGDNGPDISDLGDIMKEQSDVLDVLDDNDNNALNNSIPKGSKVILKKNSGDYYKMIEADNMLIATIVDGYIDSWCNGNKDDREIWKNKGWDLINILKESFNFCSEMNEDKEKTKKYKEYLKENIIERRGLFIDAYSEVHKKQKIRRREKEIEKEQQKKKETLTNNIKEKFELLLPEFVLLSLKNVPKEDLEERERTKKKLYDEGVLIDNEGTDSYINGTDSYIDGTNEIDLRGGGKTEKEILDDELLQIIEKARGLVDFEKNHIYETIEYNIQKKKYTLINGHGIKIIKRSNEFEVIEYNREFNNLYRSQENERDNILAMNNDKNIQEKLQIIEEKEDEEEVMSEVSKGTDTNYSSIINRIVNTQIIKFTPEELIEANQIAKRNYIRCVINKAHADAQFNYIQKGLAKTSVIVRLKEVIDVFKNGENIKKAINNLVSIEFTIYKGIVMLIVSLFNPWVLTGIAFLCGSQAMAIFLMQLISFLMVLATVYPEIYRFFIKCANGGKGIELKSLMDVIKNMFNLYLITMMGYRLLTAGSMMVCTKTEADKKAVEKCVNDKWNNMGNPLKIHIEEKWDICDNVDNGGFFTGKASYFNPACLLKWIVNGILMLLNFITNKLEWVILNTINFVEGKGMSVFQGTIILLNIYMYSIDEEVSTAYANVKAQIKKPWQDETFNIVDFNERLKIAADSGPPPKWNNIVNSEKDAGDAAGGLYEKMQQQKRDLMSQLQSANSLKQTQLQGRQTDLQAQQLTAANTRNEIMAQNTTNKDTNKDTNKPTKNRVLMKV